MSQKAEFGRCVRRAREDLGISRKRLAQLVGTDSSRVEMIEIGQMDESDLTVQELRRFSDVLGRSSSWPKPGLSSPAGIIRQRSRPGPAQQEISFGSDRCPRCYHALAGSRCDNCGLFLD